MSFAFFEPSFFIFFDFDEPLFSLCVLARIFWSPDLQLHAVSRLSGSAIANQRLMEESFMSLLNNRRNTGNRFLLNDVAHRNLRRADISSRVFGEIVKIIFDRLTTRDIFRSPLNNGQTLTKSAGELLKLAGTANIHANQT